jgi:predicted DNA-binding transcriptional regulator AlpA
MNKSTDQYLSPGQVAILCSCSTGQLAAWRHLNRGPRWRRLGAGRHARVQYLRADVDEWLASLPQGGGQV